MPGNNTLFLTELPNLSQHLLLVILPGEVEVRLRWAWQGQ